MVANSSTTYVSVQAHINKSIQCFFAQNVSLFDKEKVSKGQVQWSHDNQDNDKIEMISYISNMKTQTCYLLLHSYTLLYDQCTHDGPISVQSIKDYLDDSLWEDAEGFQQ